MRVLSFLMALFLAVSSDYLTELAHWRTSYEDRPKAPGGWLSVSGLLWVHEGENTVGPDPRAEIILRAGTPRRAGVLRMKAGAVPWQRNSAEKHPLKPGVPVNI